MDENEFLLISIWLYLFISCYNCDALKADDSFSKNEFTNTSCVRFWTEYLDTTSILSHAAHTLQQNQSPLVFYDLRAKCIFCIFICYSNNWKHHFVIHDNCIGLNSSFPEVSLAHGNAHSLDELACFNDRVEWWWHRWGGTQGPVHLPSGSPQGMALNRTWGIKDDNDFKGGQSAMEDGLQWEVQQDGALWRMDFSGKSSFLRYWRKQNQCVWNVDTKRMGFLPVQREDESAGLCDTQRALFCSKYKTTILRRWWWK